MQTIQPARRLLIAALTGCLALGTLAAPGVLGADCRSNIECIPPVTTATIDGLAGENDWWRSDVTATLVCIDASGCSTSSYSLDGSAWTKYEAPFPVVGEGLHALEGASEDRHGNKEIYPTLTMIRIDTTAPSLAWTQPTQGNVFAANIQDPLEPALPATIVAHDVTVEVALADTLSGAQRAEFFVDGVARSIDTAAPYTWQWEAGDEAAGEHILTVVGYDVAGNSATLSQAVLTVPTSADGVQATIAAVSP